MFIKAISGKSQNYFTKSIAKKTKTETVVTASFAQLKAQKCYLSSSPINHQLLLFSCKGRITGELKGHFHCPSETRFIEGVAECFDNLIIESDDVETMVSNVMIEKKFPISEYAIIFREKMVAALKNSAFEFKGN